MKTAKELREWLNERHEWRKKHSAPAYIEATVEEIKIYNDLRPDYPYSEMSEYEVMRVAKSRASILKEMAKQQIRPLELKEIFR